MTFGRLLESPGDRERSARLLLDLVNDTFPARHSALLVVDEAGEGESLEVAAARGAALTLDQAEWVERIARESLARCQVLGRESAEAALSSFLWVPVLCRGERLAVLELGEGRGHWFASDRTRDLAVIADEIGRLLDGSGRVERAERERCDLEQRVVSQARKLRDLERRVVASAGRDALLRTALRRARQATDPASYVSSNLHAACEEIGFVRDVFERLVDASSALLAGLPSDDRGSAREALEAELESARSCRFQALLDDLTALSEEVEEGAAVLRDVGGEFRELALGETAPEVWVDARQLIEATVDCVGGADEGKGAIALRIDELPPLRCQRLRVECLLVLLLERALELAGADADVILQASLRGSAVLLEICIEGLEPSTIASVEAIREDQDSFFDSIEQARVACDLIEDQGGRLEIDAADDLVSIRVDLPVDHE
ncbi:MAG: hypothetical protein GY944_04115 [bacterium]|nr:hypothetical protein [bacterium]